jgi:GT2 family glycosyltransferase
MPTGIRRLIKQEMTRLFANELLSEEEISRLQTAQYARENFGIRQPILRELDPSREPHLQRMVDGKTKYWMETFVAHGKKYFVYKNWLEGRSRNLFLTWLSKIEK